VEKLFFMLTLAPPARFSDIKETCGTYRDVKSGVLSFPQCHSTNFLLLRLPK